MLKSAVMGHFKATSECPTGAEIGGGADHLYIRRKSLKESKVIMLKKTVSTKDKTKSVSPTVVVTVTVRRQTFEENRRFSAALDLFLHEMVREELNQKGGKNEQKGT